MYCMYVPTVTYGSRVMQVWRDFHTSRKNDLKEAFEGEGCCLRGDMKRFFKLFEDSTFEGSRTASLEMTKIVKRHIKQNQMFMLFGSLYLHVHSDTKMLSWPNTSPLFVLLQFVDPNAMSEDEHEPLQEG
jgi:hypothetical protein